MAELITQADPTMRWLVPNEATKSEIEVDTDAVDGSVPAIFDDGDE